MSENYYGIQFFRFLLNEISLAELEEWIYNTPELEKEIGTECYMEIISFNFRSKFVVKFLKSIVGKCFGWFEYEKWRAIKFLSQIKDNKIETVLASRILAQLYYEQESNIELPLISIGLGMYYDSEMDMCPTEDMYQLWNEEALKNIMKRIELFRPEIIKNAEEELNEIINSDLIVVDLTYISDIEQAHGLFKRKLGLTEYRGKDWATLLKAISMIEKPPNELRLIHWKKFEHNFQKDSKILRGQIKAFNEKSNDFQIKIACYDLL